MKLVAVSALATLALLYSFWAGVVHAAVTALGQ